MGYAGQNAEYSQPEAPTCDNVVLVMLEHTQKVAELTGRRVIAFMSANSLDPDLASEIYVLDGQPDYTVRVKPAVG